MTKNILKIKELFPNCVTEAKDKNDKITLKIDFETLKQELSDDIIGENQEKYEFTWSGKKKSIFLANQPTADILRMLNPCGFLGHPATLSGVAPFGQVRCPLPASLSTDN